MNMLEPFVERRYEETEPTERSRKQIAENILSYLKNYPEYGNPHSDRGIKFYDACCQLLEDKSSERILLYLPLGCLSSAVSVTFITRCRDAWYSLLRVRDVRENFHLGDCFELDARPHGGLERVVKCAHLTPWLLEHGYLKTDELVRVIEVGLKVGDEVLLQSFKDTWDFIESHKIIPSSELFLLRKMTSHLPERQKQEPLYISKKRREWLAERDQPVELLTPEAKLEAPFRTTIPTLRPQFEEIAARLGPDEIVLVGGSQLKGYGTSNSDLDVYELTQINHFGDMYLYYNTVWLGGERMDTVSLETTRSSRIARYDLAQDGVHDRLRRLAIERLESDLLQYRLLHKGFARFTGRNQFSDVPVEMDGDCPFYDDEYRRIATMLYAKYVWI